MTSLKYAALAAVVASVALAAGSANASLYNFTYTDIDGVTIDASGTLTLAGPNGTFGETVTDITGQYLGSQITGLVANPNSPTYATTPNGHIVYDNNFDPTTPALDYFGLLFTISGGAQINLYGLNSPSFSYTNAGPGASALDLNANTLNTGTLSVTAVPEPAAWAMMLVGFGGLGAVLRSRRKLALATA